MIGSINNATDAYAVSASANAPRAEQAQQALANAPGLNRGEDTVEISSQAQTLESAVRFAPPQKPDDPVSASLEAPPQRPDDPTSAIS